MDRQNAVSNFLDEIARECESLRIWLEAESQQARSLSPHVLASRWSNARFRVTRQRLGLLKYVLGVPRK